MIRALLAADDTRGDAQPLRIAAALMTAMELGLAPMNANEHRLLARWAQARFTRLDVPTLRTLLADDPGPLRELIENELYVRADLRWTSNNADHEGAETGWTALHGRCRIAPTA